MLKLQIAIGLLFLVAAACVQNETQRKRAIDADVYNCIKRGGDPSREWHDGQRLVVCRPSPLNTPGNGEGVQSKLPPNPSIDLAPTQDRKESRLPQWEGKDLPPGYICYAAGAAGDCITKPEPYPQTEKMKSGIIRERMSTSTQSR